MFAQNENIIIRAAEPKDASLIYKWENDQEIWRVSETYMPYSLYQIEEFLLNNSDLFSMRQIRFIIERKEDNTNIGCIDLYDFDPNYVSSLNDNSGMGTVVNAAGAAAMKDGKLKPYYHITEVKINLTTIFTNDELKNLGII